MVASELRYGPVLVTGPALYRDLPTLRTDYWCEGKTRLQRPSAEASPWGAAGAATAVWQTAVQATMLAIELAAGVPP